MLTNYHHINHIVNKYYVSMCPYWLPDSKQEEGAAATGRAAQIRK